MAGDEYIAAVANVMIITGGPVPTETHSNQVHPNEPTQVTSLPGSIKEPSKPDSGNSFLPTEFPGQPDIQGQTLIPGEALTQSGTPISLASDGSQLIVGTSTQAIPSDSLFPDNNASPQTRNRKDGIIYAVALPADGLTSQTSDDLTLKSGISRTKFGTSTFAAASEAPVLQTNPPGRFLIQGQTLTPGEAVTGSGTLISLASDGSQLIVGKSTHAVALAPSVTRNSGMLSVLQPLQAIPANTLTPQPTDGLTLKSGYSSTIIGPSALVAANESPIIAGASNTVIARPSGTTQSTELPSKGQSAVDEGQQQSFIHSRPVAASGSVFVSGTLVSLGPGLPNIVMGTQVQTTGSHGTGSSSRGFSNGTSTFAFQGYGTRVQVTWGRFVTIAFFALISMFLV